MNCIFHLMRFRLINVWGHLQHSQLTSMIMFVSLAGEYKCFCVPDGRSAQCGLVGRVCMYVCLCVCTYVCLFLCP